jgi:hypothetical protein
MASVARPKVAQDLQFCLDSERHMQVLVMIAYCKTTSPYIDRASAYRFHVQGADHKVVALRIHSKWAMIARTAIRLCRLCKDPPGEQARKDRRLVERRYGSMY